MEYGSGLRNEDSSGPIIFARDCCSAYPSQKIPVQEELSEEFDSAAASLEAYSLSGISPSG